MGKRLISLMLVSALFALLSGAMPAAAQEPPPPTIPAVPNIEDPIGDANGLNDQGQAGTIGHQGERVTPADAGSVSDFQKIWFTNDAETVSVHILNEAAGPAINGLRFDVYTTPGEGSAASSTLGCIRFVAIIGGKFQGQSTTWHGPDSAKVFDACNDGTNWFNNGVEAQLQYGEHPDGGGFVTITAPQSASPFLAVGQVLSAPQAAARVAYGEAATVAGSFFVTDNTVIGTDYTITAPPTDAQDDDDLKPGPGKGKGCDKGKGKKKGCKKGGSESAALAGGSLRL